MTRRREQAPPVSLRVRAGATRRGGTLSRGGTKSLALWISVVLAAALWAFITLSHLIDYFFPSASEDFRPGATTARSATIPLTTSSWQELDDPLKDGWDTEAFSLKAKKQLTTLGKLITHPEIIDAARVEPLAVETFSCGPLKPNILRTVFRDRGLRVERLETAPESSNPESHTHVGIEGLAEALRSLSAPFRDASDARVEFKVFRVKTSPELL